VSFTGHRLYQLQHRHCPQAATGTEWPAAKQVPLWQMACSLHSTRGASLQAGCLSCFALLPYLK